MSARADLPFVAHVHSTYSDGTASVDEILSAARSAGARGVLLTDHDTLGARADGLQGWHDGVLLVVGHEVSPKRGHLLVFGTEATVSHAGRSEREIVGAAVDAGGLAVAAHPFSTGSRMSRTVAPPHAWEALDDPRLGGIELWSLVTESAEAWRTPAEALRFLRDPHAVLDGPPQRNLDAWDRLGAVRRLPAIGGLDAHQSGVRVGGRLVTPFPHERYFRLLQTHVVLDGPPSGDGEADAAAVLDSIAAGRAYLAMPWLAPAGGFALWATSGERRLAMGGEAPAGDWTLHVRLPRPADIRVLADGRLVHAEHADRADVAVTRGVVRAEAVLRHGGRDRRWIVSNPVYLR